MNAVQRAKQAYAPTHSSIHSSRSVEYQAFSSIIGRLKGCADGGKKSFPALVQVLNDNRKLWTLLAADVADPGNNLPESLRAQIFYLAEFTDAHTRKVLRGEAKVDALLEINTAVMRGLTQTTSLGERIN